MRKFDSITKYYALRAPEYEQIYYRDIPAKRKELAGEAERLKKLVAGKSVFDLACGTGYWTAVICQTAREVVASDISAEMISEARTKEYVCQPDFVRADLYELPFKGATFDILTLGFWFSHEPKQNYCEFFRMLKTLVRREGLIWMIDNNPPAEGPKYRSVGTDDYGNNYRQRFLDSGEEFAILKNYFTSRGLREMFSPEFAIESIIFNECYWSVVLKDKAAPGNPATYNLSMG
ncbi:MAG: class I SAM-dependent methyltransferase [Candidatus Zixiibacteriota bacterium]|nr:MAG: class I SAM-dependent methyltransferase [candidate division Zixibacteria bacterium]